MESSSPRVPSPILPAAIPWNPGRGALGHGELLAVGAPPREVLLPLGPLPPDPASSSCRGRFGGAAPTLGVGITTNWALLSRAPPQETNAMNRRSPPPSPLASGPLPSSRACLHRRR